MTTFISEATEPGYTFSKKVRSIKAFILFVGELETIFSDFAIDQLVVDRRLLVNRQNLKKMYRVWYQGRFRKLKQGEVKLNNPRERGIRDVDESLE